ncbi:MAG: hypothetical protein K2Q26_00810 [Bdellovibrionales bacterium]|nr:hypothetical protein [Bdellovibrionales bacterium]
MKFISFLCVFVFVSLTYAASSTEFYSWTPKLFELNTQGLQIAMDVMDGSDDPAYVGIKKLFPEVDQEYIPTLEYYYRKNFQSRILPREFRFQNYDYYDQLTDEDIADGVIADSWHVIKYMGAEIYDRLSSAFYIPTYGGDSIPYGFCDTNPGDNESLCLEPQRNTLYSFIARSVSNPYFVNYTCDSILPMYIWEMEWGAQKTLDYKKSKTDILKAIAKLDKTLAYLENGGNWVVTPEFIEGLDQFKLPYDTKGFIVRRYYDGGPKLVRAVRKCMERGRARIAAATQEIPKDASVSLKLNETLKFKPLTSAVAPVKTYDVSNGRLHRRDVYRLLRQMDPKMELPSYVAEEITYGDSGGYYSNGSMMNGVEMRALARILGRLDPSFSYRLLTKDELESFLVPKAQPQMNAPEFADGYVQDNFVRTTNSLFDGQNELCLSDKGQKEFVQVYYYVGEDAPSYSEMHVEEECHLTKWRIVRELK